MILLDTNALIWLLRDEPDLGDEARDLISTHHPVYYSAVSVQEMTIKKMKGRLQVPPHVSRFLDAQHLRQMPFTAEHAEGMEWFPELASHDPFDRAILAQAKVESLKLVTSDRVLLGLGQTWIVDAQK